MVCVLPDNTLAIFEPCCKCKKIYDIEEMSMCLVCGDCICDLCGGYECSCDCAPAKLYLLRLPLIACTPEPDTPAA